MNKPAAAILILLVAAMASWWVWSTRSQETDLAGVEIQTAPGDDTENHQGSAPGIQPGPRRTVDPRAQERVLGGTPGKERLDFEIQVRRLSDKQVVAGAEVSICDFDLLMAKYAMIAGPRTLDAKDAARKKISHIAHTDENGIVRASLPIERAVILVTHHDLYGRKVLKKAQAGSVEVLLDDDRSLRVRVLSSASRRPVPGVTVGLYANRRSGGSSVTDDAGLVVFRHVQESLRGAEDGRVGLALPLREPVRCPVSLANLPSDAVELILPPTGSIAIRVRDEKGRMVDCRRLRMTMEAFLDPGFQQKLPRARPMVSKLGAKGHARSGPMDLGLHLRLTVEAMDRDSARRPVVTEFAGPTRLDEVVEQGVPWPSEDSTDASWPVLTGRFVHNDGSPWVETTLNAYAQLFPYDPKAHRSVDLTTDDKGCFRLVLSIPCPPGGKRIYLLHVPGKAGYVRGEVDASRDYPPGVTDLGDILLDQGRLVVSGRVVDLAGKGIPKARVRVTQKVGIKDNVYWPTYKTAGSFGTDPDGRFACYAIPGHDLPQDSLRLEVRHPETNQRKTLRVALGQQGVRVEFAPGGGIAGSVQLGETLESRDVNIVLMRESKSVRLLTLDPDGSFEGTGIQPGTYSVHVALRTASQELRKRSKVRIEEVRILPGETNRDPRLQGIHLTDTGHKLRIRVRDESGNPISGGHVDLLRASWRDTTATDHRGLAVLLVPGLPVGVRVSCYGYSVVEIPALESDRTVTLRRGLSVRLVTDAKTVGKNPNYSLGGFIYHVRPDGKTGRRAYGLHYPHEKVHFDSARRIECMLPGPGTYEFHPWFYYQSNDNVGRGGSPKMTSYPRFTVREDSQLQIFQIHIPEAAIQAEVQRVRETDTQK